jgi:hypothetical protein
MTDIEISKGEFLKKFEVIDEFNRRETSWVHRFTLVDDNSMAYNGSLHWDEDDGYRIEWYGGYPIETFRPEFEYVLDSVLVDNSVPKEIKWTKVSAVCTMCDTLTEITLENSYAHEFSVGLCIVCGQSTTTISKVDATVGGGV